MAKAAAVTIVEAENIVPIGSIHPDNVHLPGIFVDRVVPATAAKRTEVLKTRSPSADGRALEAANSAQERRYRIARRAAQELKQGYYVNLGVGAFVLGS